MELFQQWLNKKETDGDPRKSLKVAKQLKNIMAKMGRQDQARVVESWIAKEMGAGYSKLV